jgi:hypothetical protein
MGGRRESLNKQGRDPSSEVTFDATQESVLAPTDDRVSLLAAWLAERKSALYEQAVRIEDMRSGILASDQKEFGSFVLEAGKVAGQIRLINDLADFLGNDISPHEDGDEQAQPA